MKIVLILFLVALESCMFDTNKISVSLSGNKLQKRVTGDNLSTSTVSNVQIINNQLVITGNNLSNVTNVKVKNSGLTFDEAFLIESISATQIIANGTKAIALSVNSIFDLIALWPQRK